MCRSAIQSSSEPLTKGIDMKTLDSRTLGIATIRSPRRVHPFDSILTKSRRLLKTWAAHILPSPLSSRIIKWKLRASSLGVAFLLNATGFVGTVHAATNDFFPTLVLEDRSLTNARIIKVTGSSLMFRYDGGIDTVRRSDLPAELKAKYPEVDGADAAREHADNSRAGEILREQRGQIYLDCVLRERRTAAALENAQQHLRRLNEVLAVQISAARGTSRYSNERKAVSQSHQLKLGLIEQIHALEDDLRQTRAQQADYR